VLSIDSDPIIMGLINQGCWTADFGSRVRGRVQGGCREGQNLSCMRQRCRWRTGSLLNHEKGGTVLEGTGDREGMEGGMGRRGRIKWASIIRRRRISRNLADQ